MSTTHEQRLSQEQCLSRHHDGELTPAEAEALEAELSADAELQQKREGLAHLSSMMREAFHGVGDEIDADALFARVEARIAEDADDDDPMLPVEASEELERPAVSGERPRLKVVKGGAHGAPAPRPRDPAEDRGANRTMIVGALAAAAAVAFFVLRDPMTDSPTATPEPAPTLAEAAPPPGSEIEEVDFGSNTGAIFSVEGQEGEQYAVIWISDEKVEIDESQEQGI